MSPTCERIAPFLSRVAEGEAGPEEALAAGRHVQDCTPCRIRLARERRIADMVRGLGDPIEVDESFLARVMDELPSAPPRARRGRRRGLRLAGTGIAVALAGSLAATWLAGTDGGPLATWLPSSAALGTTRVAVEIGGAVARAATALAAAVVDGAAIRVDAPSLLGAVAAVAVPGLTVLAVLGSAVLLAAARLARAL